MDTPPTEIPPGFTLMVNDLGEYSYSVLPDQQELTNTRLARWDSRESAISDAWTLHAELLERKAAQLQEAKATHWVKAT